MRCPKCEHAKQKVIESRPFGEETYRKRRCKNCDFEFITYERADKIEDKKVFVRNPRKENI